MAKSQKKIDEIIELVMPPRAREKLLNNQDTLFRYIPELLTCRGFNQHNPYHVFDVLGHTLAAVDAAAEDPVVRVALLFHDIGKPISYQEGDDGIRHFHGHSKISAEIAQRVLERLGADKIFCDDVVRLVRAHDCFISVDVNSVEKLIQKLGLETFDRLLCVREADIKAQNPACAEQRLDKLNALKAIRHQVCCTNLTLPTDKSGGFSVRPPQPASARSYTVSPSVWVRACPALPYVSATPRGAALHSGCSLQH